VAELDWPDMEDARPLVASSNGHEPPAMVDLRTVLGAPTSRAPGFEPGRQVDPRGKHIWGVFDAITRRDYGRDEQFIAALKAIRDFDPQSAHAVWNFLRLLNPGYDLLAISDTSSEPPPGRAATRLSDGSRVHLVPGYKVVSRAEDGETPKNGGEEARPLVQNAPGQEFLDQLQQRVGEEYGGGGDQFHNVCALSLITTGALCTEVAPTADLRDVEDWYVNDPLLMSFKRIKRQAKDSIGKLTLGQKFVTGDWIAVNPNQVFYVPLDPDVDDPYGRPPLMPALQTVLAKSQMINDLRAVAHNQGYPRIDVKVLWETLIKGAPPNLRDAGKANDLTAWANRQLQNIVKDYAALKVDDTFVHYDWIDLGMIGPNFAASSFDFKGLEAILSRQINSALKTLPILLGYNESSSETHGSIQWQIQVAGVLTLQRLIKRCYEKLATTSLRIAGIPARGRVIYKPIRTVDRKYEAESAFLEGKTHQLFVQMGWEDNNEAAQKTTGHDARGEATDGAMGIKPPPTAPGAKQTNKENQDQEQTQGGTTSGSGGQKESVYGTVIDHLLTEGLGEGWQYLAPAPQRRAPDFEERVEVYGKAGSVIFMQAKQEFIEVLQANGLLEVMDEERDTSKDVSDYVFGLRFSRQMKGLLRRAVREGMERAGYTDPQLPENLIERIWRENRQYVNHIRDDLKAALRAGAFKSIADIDEWFHRNAWRESLMGFYLGRQGMNAGYAYAVNIDFPNARLVWQLGAAEKHCNTCSERDGNTYTFDELQVIGFPGSTMLDCGAGCRCSVTENEEADNAAA
jgi:hypothetical protein